MAFQTIGYQSDDGEVYNLRVSSDTVTAAGGSAGATTSDMFVKVTKSDREFGMRPRYANLSETFTTAGGRTFKTYKRLPLTTLAAYNALSKGDTVTIGSISYEVAGKEPEDY